MTYSDPASGIDGNLAGSQPGLMRTVSDPKGTVFGGSYRLLRLLGEGGMGAVYEAEHLRVPRRFAVKLMKPEIAANAELFERFRREAEIASRIGNDHIVEVFDFNVSDDGTPYMVLELLKGEALGDRLARRPLTLDQTAAILADTASALDATHSHGVIHRDLKPQNLFLVRKNGRDDFVKVLDFGISKVLEDSSVSTQSGAILGTPSYMSPEQVEGKLHHVDHRTDVFALGAILFECLTGFRAFGGPTIPSILYKICHVPTPSMRELVPEIPEAIESIVSRAMSKRREDRHDSAGDLAEAFLRVCGRTFVREVNSREPLSVDVGVVRQSSLATDPTVNNSGERLLAMPTAPARRGGANVLGEAETMASGEHPAAPSTPTVRDELIAEASGTLATSSRQSSREPSPAHPRGNRRALAFAAIVFFAASAASLIVWKARHSAASTPVSGPAQSTTEPSTTSAQTSAPTVTPSIERSIVAPITSALDDGKVVPVPSKAATVPKSGPKPTTSTSPPKSTVSSEPAPKPGDKPAEKGTHYKGPVEKEL